MLRDFVLANNKTVEKQSTGIKPQRILQIKLSLEIFIKKLEKNANVRKLNLIFCLQKLDMHNMTTVAIICINLYVARFFNALFTNGS